MSSGPDPETALSYDKDASKKAIDLRRVDTVLRRTFAVSASVMIASIVVMVWAGVPVAPFGALAVASVVCCLCGAFMAMLAVVLGSAVASRIEELESVLR